VPHVQSAINSLLLRSARTDQSSTNKLYSRNDKIGDGAIWRLRNETQVFIMRPCSSPTSSRLFQPWSLMTNTGESSNLCNSSPLMESRDKNGRWQIVIICCMTSSNLSTEKRGRSSSTCNTVSQCHLRDFSLLRKCEASSGHRFSGAVTRAFPAGLETKRMLDAHHAPPQEATWIDLTQVAEEQLVTNGELIPQNSNGTCQSAQMIATTTTARGAHPIDPSVAAGATLASQSLRK
jgi:hypothetical protein